MLRLRDYREEFKLGDFHNEIVKYLEDQCFNSITFRVNYYETCEDRPRTKIKMELTFRARNGSDLFYFDICPDYLAEEDDDDITANITYRKSWIDEDGRGGGVFTLTNAENFRIDYRKENYISSFIKLLHNCIYDFSNC